MDHAVSKLYGRAKETEKGAVTLFIFTALLAAHAISKYPMLQNVRLQR